MARHIPHSLALPAGVCTLRSFDVRVDVVLQRQQLADALARYMSQLGLQKRAKQLPDLKTYLNGNESELNKT